MVVINKIDRPDARPQEVLNEVYDLFIDLDADESVLDFPVLYTNGKLGTATTTSPSPEPTFSPSSSRSSKPSRSPRATRKAPSRSSLPTSTTPTTSVVSLIGRVFNGTMRTGQEYTVAKIDGSFTKHKITKLFSFSGLKRTDIEETTGRRYRRHRRHPRYLHRRKLLRP